MAKIFVTQEPHQNIDFSDAERYGQIEFLTHRDLINVRGSSHNEELVADIAAKLEGFDHKEDYIVIVGSPYVAAVVFMILGMRGYRTVRVLRWDNRDLVYRLVFIELRSL